MVRLAEQIEPESGNLGQHPPFVRDAGGQYPVEGADAVRADQQKAIAQIVDIAHLAAVDRQPWQGCLSNRSIGHSILG